MSSSKDCATKLVPPLKWAGGKRWLLPHVNEIIAKNVLASNLSNDFRLVEPFSGGLAIALGLNPKRALLADINRHLINFYQEVARGLKIEIELQNDAGVFYRHRSRFNQLIREGLDRSSEAAQLFYYLNRTCFNGLCRFNSRGEYNVPFGKYKKINYIPDFYEYQQVFAGWDFCATDFSSLEIKSGDLLYVDPPYDVEFTRYSEQDFKWEDQVRLVEWLKALNQPMIVSNQATERVLELYRSAGFYVSLLSAPRRIACTGDRTPASEMLAVRGLSLEGDSSELIKPISNKFSDKAADLVTRSAGA